MQEQPMKRCANGHYYRHEHTACPHCAGGSANANVNVVPPVDPGKTVPADRTEPDDAFVPGDGDKTRPDEYVIGMDPVVGWLVCIEGEERGRDYRIHSDYNYIGRGGNMDVCVRGDDKISRDSHAVLVYDTHDKIFYFKKGPDGRGVVRLNGKAVMDVQELKAYDTIQLGNTKLIFVPLCGEGFDWLA